MYGRCSSRWRSVAGCCAAACVLAVFPAGSVAYGQDSAGLKTRPGRRPIHLWPPAEDEGDRKQAGRSIDLGGWTYRAVKSRNPRDGVPWELIVTPTGENAKIWQEGAAGGRGLPLAALARRAEERAQNPNTIPAVEIPDVLWKQWMAADLRDVVGVHYHELVTDDQARILFTVHKVPPDPPDGKPPAPGSYPGRSGCRIEATLVTPVIFSLDQTVVVRKDPLHEASALRRAEHESGHAQLSQRVFLEVLRGPQDWNLDYCTGRRSRLAYYWKREHIGRSWDGYREGVGRILTLRTSVAVVPPTRWSMLLPIPPERVTREHLEAFNQAIVMVGPLFAQVDHKAQAQFHARHGEYERASSP